MWSDFGKDGDKDVWLGDCSKRERYAQVLCVSSLLAASLQVAVWFMWNCSLYRLAFIYRLNQSKVYIWSNFCNFADVGQYGHTMTFYYRKPSEYSCAPFSFGQQW